MTPSSEAVDSSSSSSSNSYYYLFLLLLVIPFVCLLVLAFVLALGRRLQMHMHYWCDLLLCPCARPDDQEAAHVKHYDATICFSRCDEAWIDGQFVPQLSQFENNFKIHKLCSSGAAAGGGGGLLMEGKVGRENERILRSSKRIIVVMSRRFVDDDWSSSKAFRATLADICRRDRLCVVVCLNVGELSERRLDTLLDEMMTLTSGGGGGDEADVGTWHKLKSTVRYNCGLSPIERLHIGDALFWHKFNYIMPRIGYDDTKPAIITRSSSSTFKSHSTTTTTRSQTAASLSSDAATVSTTAGSSMDSSDMSLDASKHKPRRYNNHKEHKQTSQQHPQQQQQQHVDKDMHLSYASNYKNSSNLRHIIVPIPDFMRTHFGKRDNMSATRQDQERQQQHHNSKQHSSSRRQMDSSIQSSEYSVSSAHAPTLSTNKDTTVGSIDDTIGADEPNEIVHSSQSKPTIFIPQSNNNNNKSSAIDNRIFTIANPDLDIVQSQAKHYMPPPADVNEASGGKHHQQQQQQRPRDSLDVLDMFRPKSYIKKEKRKVERH